MTKKKSARTHNVSILLDPTDYFTKYDVVVTTYTIVTCNEVNSKTAVRKSAWIKRRQKSPMSSKKTENQSSYLHLTSYERVIVDQAHTFATTTSKSISQFENYDVISGGVCATMCPPRLGA